MKQVDIEKNLLDLKHGRNFNLFLMFIAAGLSLFGVAVTLIVASQIQSVWIISGLSFIIAILFLLSVVFALRANSFLEQIKNLK